MIISETGNLSRALARYLRVILGANSRTNHFRSAKEDNFPGKHSVAFDLEKARLLVQYITVNLVPVFIC